MKKYIILFTLFILISCGHKLDSEVEKAVSYISKYETCILDDFVFQTPSYVRLMNVASNDDLVYLSNDKNPVVRYFAFIGLMERNYERLMKYITLIKMIQNLYQHQTVRVWKIQLQ